MDVTLITSHINGKKAFPLNETLTTSIRASFSESDQKLLKDQQLRIKFFDVDETDSAKNMMTVQDYETNVKIHKGWYKWVTSKKARVNDKVRLDWDPNEGRLNVLFKKIDGNDEGVVGLDDDLEEKARGFKDESGVVGSEGLDDDLEEKAQGFKDESESDKEKEDLRRVLKGQAAEIELLKAQLEKKKRQLLEAAKYYVMWTKVECMEAVARGEHTLWDAEEGRRELEQMYATNDSRPDLRDSANDGDGNGNGNERAGVVGSDVEMEHTSSSSAKNVSQGVQDV